MDISTLSPAEKEKLMKDLAQEQKDAKAKIKQDRKSYKELSGQFVTDNIDFWVSHNQVTEQAIKKLFDDFEAIKELKQEAYGEHVQHYDSHTSTLFDGSASLTIGFNVSIKFDGSESAGIEKIKNFINSLSTDDEKSKKLSAAVNTFLKLNPKTGMLNPSKIIELSKLREEFNDERFNDGLDIIFNAQIRTHNSMYVSGWKYIEFEGKPKKLQFRFTV